MRGSLLAPRCCDAWLRVDLWTARTCKHFSATSPIHSFRRAMAPAAFRGSTRARLVHRRARLTPRNLSELLPPPTYNPPLTKSELRVARVLGSTGQLTEPSLSPSVLTPPLHTAHQPAGPPRHPRPRPPGVAARSLGARAGCPSTPPSKPRARRGSRRGSSRRRSVGRARGRRQSPRGLPCRPCPTPNSRSARFVFVSWVAVVGGCCSGWSHPCGYCRLGFTPAWIRQPVFAVSALRAHDSVIAPSSHWRTDTHACTLSLPDPPPSLPDPPPGRAGRKVAGLPAQPTLGPRRTRGVGWAGRVSTSSSPHPTEQGGIAHARKTPG